MFYMAKRYALWRTPTTEHTPPPPRVETYNLKMSFQEKKSLPSLRRIKKAQAV